MHLFSVNYVGTAVEPALDSLAIFGKTPQYFVSVCSTVVNHNYNLKGHFLSSEKLGFLIGMLMKLPLLAHFWVVFDSGSPRQSCPRKAE